MFKMLTRGILLAWIYSVTHTEFYAYHQSSQGLTSKGPAIQKLFKIKSFIKLVSISQSNFGRQLTAKFLVTCLCSIFLANGLILILLLLGGGVGVVVRIQSSMGSIAPTNIAFKNSSQSYASALMFWVNGSEIKLYSLLEMILLTETKCEVFAVMGEFQRVRDNCEPFQSNVLPSFSS